MLVFKKSIYISLKYFAYNSITLNLFNCYIYKFLNFLKANVFAANIEIYIADKHELSKIIK